MFLNRISLKLGNILEAQKSWLFAMIFLLLIFFDQIIKHYASNVFQNKYFAFSLPMPNFISYFIYSVVLYFILRHLWLNRFNLSNLENTAWAFILSGAISNIVERIFFGFVKDWFYVSAFGFTGIYNLADGYILFGICLLLWLGIQKKEIHLAKR